MKRLSLAAALLMMALALPASAEDAPGVFKVPGTDSTIKFYGYVQLDATLDFSGRVANIEGLDWATALPGVPNDDSPEAKRKKGQFYLTGRTSRFGIQTSTPSDMGPVGARLEADFNGPNGDQSETYTNSVVFRLRHAYGTVGNLLVGQTWTTFLDFGGAPETVDFNGPGTLALVRNPMIRYTLPLGQGMNLALAAENARGAQFGGAKYQTLPDLHANFGYSASWGSVSVRGVTQQYNVATGADTASKTAFSVAGAISGQVKAGAKDTIQAQFAGGPGIGRYLLNAFGAVQNLPGSDPAAIGGNPGAFRIEANGDLKLINVVGYHVGLTHVWTPKIRSNVVWSQTFVSDPDVDGVAAGAETQKTMSQAFVNSFFTLTKTAEIGVEYAWGQWKDFGSPAGTGTQNRVNASFHYNFF
jgi:outer membrane DcaP-like protein